MPERRRARGKYLSIRQRQLVRERPRAVRPPHLKAQVERELDRLELLLKQIKTVEGERTRCWPWQ